MTHDNGSSSRIVRLLARIYALSLRLLPARIRIRDGVEMASTFEMRAAEVRASRGAAALVLLFVAEIQDVLRCALRRGAIRGGSLAAPTESSEWQRLRSLLSSAHQAVRYVRARPGNTLVFVGTFALGLGLNAAMFALVAAIALRPLPYREPDRLVQLWQLNEATRRDAPFLPADVFLAWSEFGDILDGMEGWTGPGTRALTGDGAPERIDAPGVTTGLASFLGVHPQIGRWFEGAEGEAGGPRVVIIGDGLWSRRFGRDPAVLGRPVTVDGESYTIIGVMPRGFSFPYGTSEAWFPLARNAVMPGEAGGLSALARLRPGIARETAEEVLVDRVRAAQREGAAPPDVMPMVVGLADFLQTPERTQQGLLMLFGSVLLVLAIAVANVLSLRMADVLRRDRELAMRSAMGAGRGRILAQLAVEGFLLSMLGAVLGLALAQALLQTIVPMLPEQLGINTGGRPLTLWPDGVAYGLVISAIAGPVIGILPSLLLPHRRSILHSGVRTTSERRGVRLQGGLIAAEAALSLVLLTGAGLLLNSFIRLTTRDPGLAADELIVAEVTLGPTYASDAERGAQFERLAERLRRVDGVRSVAMTTSSLPRGLARFRPRMETADNTVLELDGFLPYHEVGPGFFETAGIEVLQGRPLQHADRGTDVVVVNEVMARRLWPSGNALGSRFRARENDPWLTVVGISVDVPQMGLRDPWGQEMEYYVPPRASAVPARHTFVLRTASPERMVHAVRQAIWELDETQPIDRLEAYRDALGATVDRERFFLSLLVLFAAMATLLAAVGLHAVLSQVLVRRTPELAIRVALGAGRARVLWLTMGGSLKMVGLGIVVGLGLAALLTRFLDTLLFGVPAIDPLTFALDTLLLILVGATASLAAARRALSLDPALVMRRE